MKINAYYHLFETAHTGLLDESVNLVPESWNRFTVTNGDWMTNATLSALCYRDLFLAQQIEIVDNDKKNHYIAGDSINIDDDTYTIKILPKQYNYNFKTGLNLNEEYRYVTFSLPSTFEADDRPNPYKINKIKISSDGLYYSITKGNNYTSSATIETHNVPANSAGIIGDVTTFPEGADVVYISASNLNVFDEYYEYKSKQYHIDYWSGGIEEYREDGRCNITGIINSSLSSISSYTNISSNIFKPTDTTHFNAITGEENPSLVGGLNYICGDVNMVPSGVLFIYNNSSYYYKDINGVEHTNESNPLYAYTAYHNVSDEIVSSRIYLYNGNTRIL
jgi:hypothetical protein